MKLFFRSALCLFYAAALPLLGTGLWPQTEAPLTLLTEAGEIRLTMDEYLTGVLAGEMPAAFPEEALKAQAVASRSYARALMQRGKHGESTLCAAGSCCQSYLSERERREKWGADFALYEEKLRSCVSATEGKLLYYGDSVAEACFHASSFGCTESSEAVWGQALPYLVSVSSPESAESVPRQVSRVCFSPEELAEALGCEGDSGIGKCVRDSSGRVETLELLGQSYSGRELRSLLGLRSTDFEPAFTDGQYIFTVYGYGHGVGMSQYGAKLLAEQGYDYREILAHYYPGTEIG